MTEKNATPLDSEITAISQMAAMLNEGLLLTNSDGVVLSANHEAVQLFGVDIVSKSIFGVIERENFESVFHKAIKKPGEVDVPFRPKDDEIQREFILRINRRGDGPIALLFLDLTRQKNLETVRRDFVANVSHELRSPLTSLAGFIETMLDGDVPDEAMRKRFLGIMDEEAKRMSRLIDDLLSLSRVEVDEHIVPDNQVKLIDTMKNKTIGPVEVIEKFGVSPEYVIDVQALAGDSSDNVPGAPGIGIKTAAQLINDFGNLESLLDNCDNIKQQKRRETIKGNKKNILISKELVTLRKDVKDIPELNDLIKKEVSVEKLIPFLDELELKKLSERIRKKNPNVKIIAKSQIKTHKQRNLSDDNKIPERNLKNQIKISKSKSSYILINDEKNLKNLISEIYNVGEFVYDVETDSLNIIEANLVGVSLCFNQENAYYIPLQHVDQEEKTVKSQISLKNFLTIISPLMNDESIIKIGHNIKYDNSILNKYGVDVKGFHDTMLMSYVLDAGVNRHIMD